MASIDPKYSGTDAAVPCTPIQPTLAIEIGSQSQAGSTHGGFFEVDDVEPDGYVALHDEFMYFSDVDDEVNVAQEVNVDFDRIEPSSMHEKEFSLDSENSKIEAGALFPDVYAFRKALRHFAIKNEFEVVTLKTDKKRFIGKCRNPSCPWRVHASVIRESNVFKVSLYTELLM